VSIGVEVDGRPAAGVVVDPLLQDEFCAAVGHGTTRNGRPVRVNQVDDLSSALVATGFGYDPGRRRRQAEALVAVIGNVRDIRRCGGAATDLASVSCGRVDAYFERGLNPWDCAAGILLVTEAGGRVTDLEGQPTTGEMVVAAPVGLHGPLLDLLRSAGAEVA
jgi:myo-inositol-1(or 4)-monophosphatase